jgi:perosamine synthetase
MRYKRVFDLISAVYRGSETIGLHTPEITNSDINSVVDTLQRGMVSTYGDTTAKLEEAIRWYAGSSFACAVNSGTSGLHLSLLAAGVQPGELVITPTISFVATANAVEYCGASPLFFDSGPNGLGFDLSHIELFIRDHCRVEGRCIYRKIDNKRIAGILPVHLFGAAAQISLIRELLEDFDCPIVEDAAEAFGSRGLTGMLGTEGDIGVFSFNGNKIITGGAGGVVVTNNESWANRVNTLSRVAKTDTYLEMEYAEVGFNYRMPSINAALVLSQLKRMPEILERKRSIAKAYHEFNWEYFDAKQIFPEVTMIEQQNCWLNVVSFNTFDDRSHFLEESHLRNIGCRPIWAPLHNSPAHKSKKNMGSGEFPNATDFYRRSVCLPSGIQS